MGRKTLPPVVVVEGGTVVEVHPGCGVPLVVNLNKDPVYFALRVNGRLDATGDLKTVLKTARRALAGAQRVVLEVLDEYGDSLETFTLYKE